MTYAELANSTPTQHALHMAQQEKYKTSTCLLLLIGIPGCGKTTFSRYLAAHLRSAAQFQWNPLVVHFDDFYPPDQRQYNQEYDQTHFVMKDARHKIFSCIENFITRNNLGAPTVSSVCSQSGQIAETPSSDNTTADHFEFEWRILIDSIREQLMDCQIRVDGDGRLITDDCSRATVLLLDDNMPLRSMRYEYCQLARKYGIGFAQVCVQCSSEVAKFRNVHRPFPIPDSTIEHMKRSMEYPEPDQNRWEKLSVCINSDGDLTTFTHEGCGKVLPLIVEALRTPVTPLPQLDTALKESCQLANVDSYVHQADKVLRKCVSRQFKMDASGGAISREDRAKLAKDTNNVRKKILEELRSGEMCGSQLDPSAIGHPLEDKFKELVDGYFTKLLTEH